VLSVVANDLPIYSSSNALWSKTMKHPGVLNIAIRQSQGSATNLYVLKNGTRILNISCTLHDSTYIDDFEFDKGDVIEIQVSKANPTGTTPVISYIKLRGMIAFGDF
jgi:hypothetical protein